MTRQAAKQWVRDHQDDDDLDDDDVATVFAALYGRTPDDVDREQGLWSHCCVAVYPERVDRLMRDLRDDQVATN